MTAVENDGWVAVLRIFDAIEDGREPSLRDGTIALNNFYGGAVGSRLALAVILAHLDQLSREVHQLRAFAQAILGDYPDLGTLDGFDLEELGLKFGLLKATTVTEPCSPDWCRCADGYDAVEFAAGATCNRATPLLTGEEVVA